MPSRSLVRAFLALYITVGVVVTVLLVVFVLAFGLRRIGGYPNFNFLVLAAVVVFARVHGVRGHRCTELAV